MKALQAIKIIAQTIFHAFLLVLAVIVLGIGDVLDSTYNLFTKGPKVATLESVANLRGRKKSN